MTARAKTRARGRVWGALAALLAVASAGPAGAQTRSEPVNPVFFDDSTAAAETLERVGPLVSSGNAPEAARALQRLLDDEPERLHTFDGELYVTVRERVHAALLDSPTLLERYREIAEPEAARLLAAGDPARAERSRLLTRSGFEAALRVAQEHLEAARFGSAWRTLVQLEAHPDRRRGAPGRDAARLAVRIAEYRDTDEAWALAERWCAEAGLPAPARTTVEPPAPGGPAAVSSVTNGPSATPVDVSGIVPTPLRSIATTPAEPADADADGGLTDRRLLSYAWTLPAAAGDTVYVNDGLTVSALDRFTLHPVWRVRTSTEGGEDQWSRAQRARQGRYLEDCGSVTLAGRFVLATTGLATNGGRRGDGRLHAIDRESGRVVWSVDVADVHEDLASCSIRGPALVVGDTVVVVARKSVPTRRLVSLYMIGLDLETGAHRWHELMATAGSLPFQVYNRLADASAEADGVVYRVDEIGVAVAIDGATGRPIWVRRLPAGNYLSNDPVPAWNTSTPIVDGDTLILISPAEDEIVRLDRATGEVIGRRALGLTELGKPNYLVRVGDDLAAISDGRVAFVDAATFEIAPVRTTRVIAEPRIRGRVAVAGGSLVVPVDEEGESSVWLIDPASPRDPRVVPIEFIGNVLALAGELIVVDESRVHAYLAWSAASGQLAARMREHPDDASPAVTLAELAYHAGREGEVAPAVTAGVRALAARPDEPVRERLFGLITEIVRGALDPGQGTPVHDPVVVGGLVGHLGEIARTPEERVTQRMLAGRLGEDRGETDAAVRAYQDVLASDELAGAPWRGERLEVRAELEATRRLAALIRAHGVGVYREFGEQAARESARLLPGDGEPARSLAARYPFASVTPGLWLAAGDEFGRADRPFAALRAWRTGVSSAEVILGGGGEPDRAVVGELAGRLATALARQGRAADAGAAVDRVRAVFGPDLGVLDHGVAVDVESVLAASGSRERDVRRARIGTRVVLDGSPRLISGAVLEPVRQAGAGASSRVMLADPVRRALVSMVVDDTGALVERWSRPAAEGVVPVMLEDTDGRAILFWAPGPGSGGRLEAIGQDGGRTLWSSEGVHDLLADLPGPPAGGPGSRMVVPGGGDVALGQIVVAADRRVACLVERSGRTVAVDLDDGSAAWVNQLDVVRVADAVVAGGVLVVGGLDRPAPGAGGEPGEPARGVLVAYDARTGQRLQRVDGLGGRVRWVRATASGDVLAGMDRAVVSVNLVEGRINWVTGEAGAQGTVDAWVFGGRVLVLTEDERVFMLDAQSGRLDPDPVATGRRVTPDTSVRAHEFGDRLALCTSRGIVVIGSSGEVEGIDALDAEVLAPAAAAEGVLVTVEPTVVREPGRASAALHVLTAESARLVATAPIDVAAGVGGEATGVHVLDGRVLIGFGGVTMEVRAPAE